MICQTELQKILEQRVFGSLWWPSWVWSKCGNQIAGIMHEKISKWLNPGAYVWWFHWNNVVAETINIDKPLPMEEKTTEVELNITIGRASKENMNCSWDRPQNGHRSSVSFKIYHMLAFLCINRNHKFLGALYIVERRKRLKLILRLPKSHWNLEGHREDTYF